MTKVEKLLGKEGIKEVVYPQVKGPKKLHRESSSTLRLHDLPDHKKFDYRYWEEFLKSHRPKCLYWRILLIPLSIFLILLVYRSKFADF